MLGGKRHSGREDDGAFDVLLRHDLQAGLPFEELRLHRLGLVALVGIAGPHLLEHLLERARPVCEVEAQSRFAVEGGDPVPREDDLLAVGAAHRGDGSIVKFLG